MKVQSQDFTGDLWEFSLPDSSAQRWKRAWFSRRIDEEDFFLNRGPQDWNRSLCLSTTITPRTRESRLETQAINLNQGGTLLPCNKYFCYMIASNVDNLQFFTPFFHQTFIKKVWVPIDVCNISLLQRSWLHLLLFERWIDIFVCV